ncbi:MAG: hypothetical protein K2P87_11035 [Lachnospiraceae bacterium]|nr:hypothetical protein [Lachnospiraceae bacterium]
MVKKKLRKAMVLVLAALMTMAAVPAGTKADHALPDGSGGRCDNTYRKYVCGAYITSVSQGSHVISGGISCFITGLVHHHSIYCNSCNAYLSSNAYACTVEHSKCGSRIINHPGR